MNYACYCITRNLYDKVIPSIKSLLKNSNVDKIYLFIEDDEFPEPLPDKVETVNVAGQTYFPPDGANYHTWCTYMVLMKIALCKLLPEVDRILAIDADAFAVRDISELWKIDLGDHLLAAVPECSKTTSHYTYINGGVVMWNLKEMRESGMADRMIQALNMNEFEYGEQGCINTMCQGRILRLPPEYNQCRYAEERPGEERIIHYAGEDAWWVWKEQFKIWDAVPWEEVLK